jgi:hypothetical protein
MVTNLNDHGLGSLRAALFATNRDTASPTSDVIRFDLTGTAPYTIHLKSELPIVTHPLFLDGTSQPGYAGTPIVRLDGTNIPGGGDGLTIKPWAGSTPFSAEIAGLALVHVVDGVQVLGTGSSAALTINLHDNLIKPVGGDGIQVWAATAASNVQITSNNVVTTTGEGIIVTTAGASDTVGMLHNTVQVNGSGDGLQVAGNGTSNRLTFTSNNVMLHGPGTALNLIVAHSSTTAATIANNILNSQSLGTGLTLTAGSNFQALVQRNNFRSNLVGVEVLGDSTTAGVIDLGGGALGSTGGNNFSTFIVATDNSYAIGLFHVAPSYSMSALHNMFSVPATNVIADGGHDPAAHGSGSILV